MAKKNNKGFSLVEIIIAIAILTLLLTPIMRQFSSTMRTSRKAKETQYANEDAVYVLEYFQKDDINNIVNDKPIVDIKSDFTTGTPVVNTVECELYDVDGNDLSAKIEYTAKKYTLDDANIGPRKILYSREVVLDDLAAKLKAADEANDLGYQISYDMTTADLAKFDDDFKLTNEGSIVKYDSNGYVVAAACEATTYVTNPNEINLGNVQDLDKGKVAIIDMDASAFDTDAEKNFYAIAMEKLRAIDEASWQQAILHNDDDSILYEQKYADSVTKITKIYVEEFKDLEDESYYVVSVDVVYENNYSFNDFEGVNHSYVDSLEYNAFSQTFYTKDMDGEGKCPDIYLEYQPFVSESTKTAVKYANNDYILIDNYVKDAKLYLYRPFNDQLVALNGEACITGNSKDGYLYCTDKTQKTPVKINICNVSAKVEPMDIYTNLKCEKTPMGKFIDGQFSISPFTVIDEVLTSTKTAKYASSSALERTEFDYNKIHNVFDDKRVEERLYTITVTLTPNNQGYNVISLTGAKGAN